MSRKMWTSPLLPPLLQGVLLLVPADQQQGDVVGKLAHRIEARAPVQRHDDGKAF